MFAVTVEFNWLSSFLNSNGISLQKSHFFFNVNLSCLMVNQIIRRQTKHILVGNSVVQAKRNAFHNFVPSFNFQFQLVDSYLNSFSQAHCQPLLMLIKRRFPEVLFGRMSHHVICVH